MDKDDEANGGERPTVDPTSWRMAPVDRLAVLLVRFERVGRRADLDEAVAIGRQELAAPGGADVPRLLSLLGSALRLRFVRQGTSSDLDEAIDLGRRAVALAPHPVQQAEYLTNLALTLRERYLRRGDASDLEDAVRQAEEAVRLSRRGPGLADASSNLAAVLGTRYELTRNLADLDRSIDATVTAIVNTPVGHVDRGRQLTNLAMAFVQRFDRTSDDVDLHCGVDAAERAVRTSRSGTPQHALHLYNLGVALWEHGPVGVGSTMSAADCLRQATLTSTAVPLLRMRAAESWAGVTARDGDWRQASSAWDAAFEILPLMVDQGIGRSDRQHHLSLLAGCGPDAAAVELSLGRVGRAWLRLEQGRGVLLGQALAARAAEGRLAVEHPHLATERTRLRELLDNGTPTPEVDVVAEWNALLAQIRTRAGYEEFGTSPTAVDLPELPVDGPVVALNVSSWRCDALVLRGVGGRVETDHVPLPELTYPETVHRVNAFVAAVHAPDRGPREVVDEVLGWLWRVAVEPVLDHLGYRQPPEQGRAWPRVWWMPTGPMCLLPVHAAGRHGDGDSNASTLDRVVSSYTPTLAALRSARGRPGTAAGGQLIVGTDHAPGVAPLHHAEQEARTVSAVTGTSVTRLLGAAATRRAVTTLLPQVRRVHFACHAVAREDPSRSHLVLADGGLDVSEISASDLRDGELVYLSTCTSAYGGTTLLDESLHIASAFHLAGVRDAVATSWPLDDRIAARIAEHFYRRLAENVGPAHALHDAVRAVRRGRSPVLWAAHVHVGP